MGGKAPIAEVQLRGLRYFLPGSGCTVVGASGARTHDLTVIYRGRDTKNQKAHVAKVRSPLTFAAVSPPSWSFTYEPAPADGPFPGAAMRLDANLKTPMPTPECNTKKGLRALEFTGTLTIG